MILRPRDTVRVRAGGGSADYDVIVREGSLDELAGLLAERMPAHRYAVIADRTVATLHAPRVLDALSEAGLPADLHTFQPGEASKTRETWMSLTDALLTVGHGRDSAVVALGGGVTGDLAGFVAATFMRGVPVVQVPTSLVAMVDASVGGKTGVDVAAGKNLVGAFHPPRLVVADPRAIATLPRSDRAQGLAEAVKHGAILDAVYLRSIEERAAALLDGDADAVGAAVRRSVELKAGVVGRDERESGLREILNFGHTFGHALEAASGWRLSHGSAVSIGMVLEARLGEELGVTRAGTADALARTLRQIELPASPAEVGGLAFEPDALVDRVRMDKKAREGRPRWVLLDEPGVVHRSAEGWSREVGEDAVRAVLAASLAGA